MKDVPELEFQPLQPGSEQSASSPVILVAAAELRRWTVVYLIFDARASRNGMPRFTITAQPFLTAGSWCAESDSAESDSVETNGASCFEEALAACQRDLAERVAEDIL